MNKDMIVTEMVGAIPIISEYLNKISFISNIDGLVRPLRSNHSRLTHGETCFVMILYLLCRPHVMYRVEDWVANTTYLKILFPQIQPGHLSDDRLADTLKALQEAGIRNLFSGQSVHIIKEFNLSMKQVHCDFTNFTVHGDYNRHVENSITITYGFSKSHRADKKQFAQEVAVTDDGGVPVMTQSLSGNTADVTRYIPVWHEIQRCMGSSDFLTIGDCKLSSEENLLTIAKGNGYFAAPLAMYSTLKEQLKKLVLEEEKPLELLREIQREGTHITYHGFEIPATLVDSETGEKYTYRKIFVKSSQLEVIHLKTLENRLQKAQKEIEALQTKLCTGKKNDTKESILEALTSIYKRHDVTGLFDHNLEENISLIKKQKGRGKPGPHTEYIVIQQKNYTLIFHQNIKAIDTTKKLCGYFVLATNKTNRQMSMPCVLDAYKKEWKVEQIFERLKGPLQVVPIYLQRPDHIECMMYLLMTCAQIFTLMDREAKNTLKDNTEKLEGLFPNKIKVANPKAEHF